MTRVARPAARVVRTGIARSTTRVTQCGRVQIRITVTNKCGSCHQGGKPHPGIVRLQPMPWPRLAPVPARPALRIVRMNPVRQPGIVPRPRMPIPALVRQPRPAILPRLVPPPAILLPRVVGRRRVLPALPALPPLIHLVSFPAKKKPARKGSSLASIKKVAKPVQSMPAATLPALDRAPPALPTLSGPILALTRKTPLSDSVEASVPVGPLLPSDLARGPELAPLSSLGIATGPGLLPSLSSEDFDFTMDSVPGIELASLAPPLPPLP